MIVKSAIDEIEQYITDEANNKGFCDKVLIPDNRQDIIDIMKMASEAGVNLTICGNHTSVTASSVPQSGWVLATERLNKIIDINTIEGYAMVEPGVTLQDLQAALKPFGLYFPPDPTENSCFIGGMISTNASGAHSFKYGAVRNFIMGLEVILSNGEQIYLDNSDKVVDNHYTIPGNEKIAFVIPGTFKMPKVKNAAGYYLKNNMRLFDLFIGAEGTLGAITRAKVKVLPIPFDIISLVIFFDSLDRAFEFLNDLRKRSETNFVNPALNSIEARIIEFFDENSLKLLNGSVNGIPNDSVAAFWIEQECSSEEEYERLLLLWDDYFQNWQINPEHVWLGADESDKNKITQMRHHLPVAVNSVIKQRRLKKIGTDVALPNIVFEEFYKTITQTLTAQNIDYIAFGHFGDSHVHLNMLPRDETEAKICCDFYYKFCANAINKGGTFSAEHGVGKTKKDYLTMMFSEQDIELMKEIKMKFDAFNILGVGNIF